MYASLVEKLTDLSISVFLWGFRIAVVLVVVGGSVLTLAEGKYSGAQWLDLVADGVVQGSIYALIALGYTMVYTTRKSSAAAKRASWADSGWRHFRPSPGTPQ